MSTITTHQIDAISSAPAYSTTCEESSNVNDIEQTALIYRHVNSDGLQEEIIELIPLTGKTRGEVICEAVVNSLKAKEMDTTCIVSVANDGAPSVRRANKGLGLQKWLGQKLLRFQCILHQETLWTNLIIQIVHKIMAKGFNHWQFFSFLDKVDGITMSGGCWRGDVLKRLIACLERVKNLPGAQRPSPISHWKIPIGWKIFAIHGGYDESPRHAEQRSPGKRAWPWKMWEDGKMKVFDREALYLPSHP